MKKFLLLGMLFPLFVQAQWHVNLFGGFSNYIGDLQAKPYTTEQAHFAFGGGLQYDLSDHFSVLGNLSYARVSAADEYSVKSSVRARNLSFASRIYEGNLLLEYNLFSLNSHVLTPYVFAGIGAYHFNPYAYDSTGVKVYLQHFGTEGQGLPQYPDRKQYGLYQFNIPFGGGIKFKVTDRVVIAYEIGLRKLFTDYLDDVSSTYVDQAALLAGRGNRAVEMAYRGGELKGGGPYPGDGAIRGNVKTKDWYYLSGLRVTIALNTPRGTQEYRRKKGIIDCPEKVY